MLKQVCKYVSMQTIASGCVEGSVVGAAGVIDEHLYWNEFVVGIKWRGGANQRI